MTANWQRRLKAMTKVNSYSRYYITTHGEKWVAVLSPRTPHLRVAFEEVAPDSAIVFDEGELAHQVDLIEQSGEDATLPHAALRQLRAAMDWHRLISPACNLS